MAITGGSGAKSLLLSSVQPASRPFEGAPCAMCGDPDRAPGEWHSEDYSEPFRFQPPESYPVCKACHGRIHKRFNAEPGEWVLFCTHLDEGAAVWGLVERAARSTTDGHTREALASGSSVTLAPSSRPRTPGARWWRSLTLDPRVASLGRGRALALSGHGPAPRLLPPAFNSFGLSEQETSILRVRAAAPRRTANMRSPRQRCSR